MLIRVNGDRILFWCPGCNDVHGISVAAGWWGWNGSFESPTFTPSVLVGPYEKFINPDLPYGTRPGELLRDENRQTVVCHSFVTDGHIQFLGDCTHELANQTVPLGPLPEYLARE